MSSTTGLSRTRSLRKPTVGSNESSQRGGPSTRSEARNTSPSRLPVKPTMTTRSAATNATASSATTSRTRAVSSTTGRPLSGVYSKPTSTRPDHASNAAPRPLGRAPTTRQAPPSTTAARPFTSTNRSANTIANRPKSSGGPPPTTSNRLMGHSRSKSTVTSLTAATTLRPISQVSTTSSKSSGRASPTASTITTASSRPPQTRSQTHARAKSVSQSATSQFPPHQQYTNRPAFNNHQQHYSPAKSLAPKPLTSTYLAPPSPSKLPANVALSAETSRLQTELLQLSLLHRDAPAVDAEWHDSARRKLGARFARLAIDNEAIADLERHSVEARNVAALARWGDASNGSSYRGREPALGLEEKVQVLDEVLNGVWQLGEPGGRYQRVVAGFEVWANRMADIVTAQRGGDVDTLVTGDDVTFLGDLDQDWKHDCTSLLRKLEGWETSLRELGNIDPADADSGLAKMLGGCRTLVRDMLSELAVMSQIESDAIRAEEAWIEGMNKTIEDEDDDTPAARAYVPLWKLAA
ncbi:hypothetical protein F4677DRAFT_425513 [Hypoxylon crocopeplum]|nr:hypothetical protein F4677DRAFT_425513 [Hypoxylon crocopeplum]